MCKILVADDESRFRKIVVGFLKKDGYQVVEAEDGNQALNIISEQTDISLAILDIMMPYINGLELCKIIKEQTSIPVLIMTAKSEDEDQIDSFNSGADDYISKPINFSILLLRVRALLNMTKNIYPDDPQNYISYKNIYVDLTSHVVKSNKDIIELTKTEFEILLLLLENRGKVFSREEIKDNIWNDSNYSDLRSIDTHIKNLRIKLKENSDVIKTIRGYGYKIE